MAVLLAIGCQPVTVPIPTTAPAPSSSGSPTSPASPSPPIVFHLTASQVRMASTLMAFIDAYNGGQVEAALALVAPSGGVSDCDYRAVRVISTTGADQTRQWLRDRATDHDQLIVSDVWNDNPDPTSGSHVVAVQYSLRTSDTLRALGFAAGIHPSLVSKVVFSSDDTQIRAFANGPFGGPAELCRPG